MTKLVDKSSLLLEYAYVYTNASLLLPKKANDSLISEMIAAGTRRQAEALSQ